MDYEFEIEVGDIIKLDDGEVYKVTGVIHDDAKVYFYQGDNEVFVFFSQIDTLYKPEHKDS